MGFHRGYQNLIKKGSLSGLETTTMGNGMGGERMMCNICLGCSETGTHVKYHYKGE